MRAAVSMVLASHDDNADGGGSQSKSKKPLEAKKALKRAVNESVQMADHVNDDGEDCAAQLVMVARIKDMD